MSSKTRAQLSTEISTDWADNNSGAITPALARNTLQDLVDSAPNLTDGPFTLYSGDGTLAGARTVECSNNPLTIQHYNTVDIISDPTYAAQFSELSLNTSGFSIDCSDGVDASSFNSSGPGCQLTAKILNIAGKAGGTMIIHGPSIQICNSTSQLVAFLGATPIAQTANANQAVATDPASVITLANALRQEMIDRGFWKGSA